MKNFNYETVIGLEVHVHLKTASKVFCGCPVEWGGEPNTRVCPVCLGLPGTLPVLNEKAIELSVKAGLALSCTVSSFSKFDRKNYYYPDLPKNFQISQYDKPLSSDGFIDIRFDGKKKRVGVTRAHLEEDAGKLVHAEKAGWSGVDYNRTGIPLLEIVSEPDLRSPQEAYEYLKEIRKVLRYAEISDCDMEKGSFRCDANVSLRPPGAKKLGVKVEIKNMNSFRAVERALSYEMERQAKLLAKGEEIVQETRLYNADTQKTVSMRTKEEAHDYRYFPEPDLAPVVLAKEKVAEIRATLPELPAARADRFQKQYGLPEFDAGVLTAEKDLADYYEKVLKYYKGSNYKAVSNWITVELLALLNEDNIPIEYSPVVHEQMARIVEKLDSGEISGKMGKVLLKAAYDLCKYSVKERLSKAEEAREEIQEAIRKRAAQEASIEAIIKKEGLVQISDEGEIEGIVDRVIAAHPGPVEDFKGGKKQALGFLVGQVMKETQGKANPALVNQILASKLSS